MGPRDFGVMDPPDFVPMGPPAGAAFRPCSGVFCVARLQEQNGDASANWSVFQGSFGPAPARSWLLRRLRRSVFRRLPAKAGFGQITLQSSTGVAHHERESWMARRKLTVDRHEEIKRRLADGRSLREIATALGYSRRLVRQIRDGARLTHETGCHQDWDLDVRQAETSS